MIKTTSKKKRTNSFLIGALVCFILFLIYISALIYFVIKGGTSGNNLTLFPGGFIVDLLFTFIAPMVFQVTSVLFSTVLVRLYILVAKWMKLGKYPIHIKKLEKKFSLGEFFSRAFYAAMLSIALSIAMNNLLNDRNIPLYIENSIVYSTAAISFILTPISVLLMTPAWFLDDSGVIFMKKENYTELSSNSILTDSLDVRGIGSYFIQIIKGFAGISTPLLYILLFVKENIFRDSIELGILLILEPFFLVGSFFFSMWIYLKLAPKVKNHLLRKLKYPKIVIKIEKS